MYKWGGEWGGRHGKAEGNQVGLGRKACPTSGQWVSDTNSLALVLLLCLVTGLGHTWLAS